MEHAVLASDFDETLARAGRVEPETIAAVERLREGGRRFVLVTGRILEDLEQVFERFDVCDLVVAENGAVLYEPLTDRLDLLSAPIEPAFIEALARRRVTPLSVGKVIVATLRSFAGVLQSTIEQLGLELQTIYNRDSVMVLPAGVNKGTGLVAAVDRLGASRLDVAAIGDGENDHSLLEASGFPIAVANAVESLRGRAALVTKQPAGAGVRALITLLLERWREARTSHQ